MRLFIFSIIIMMFSFNAISSEKMMVARNIYKELPSVGPYSVSVSHGNTLYTSGMTAYGSDAEGLSIPIQAKEIFRQMKLILSEENLSMNDLIKVTIFVDSMDEISTLRDVLSTEYGDALPASSLVQVSNFFSPKVNIEIEAIFSR